MKIEKSDAAEVTITLSGDEVKWMRRVLERASFVDTPLEEQGAILGFATRALEQLERL